MNNKITVRCIKNSKLMENEVSRFGINSLFLDLIFLINGKEDIEVEKEITEILPETILISINNDINEKMEVPYVVFKKLDDECKAIKIPRDNKVVWAILERLCK